MYTTKSMPDTTITTRPLVVSPFTAFGQRVETKFKDNKIIYLPPPPKKNEFILSKF